jgi:hypothetical protein
MKFRIINIHLLKDEILPPAEKDWTETGFVSPEHLGEGIFGWEVMIQSKLNNKNRNKVLFIETATEFQFSAEKNFIEEFNGGIFFETVVELVYAAHCHHAAVFNRRAQDHVQFEDLIPKFVSLNEVRHSTEEAMRNAQFL